MSRVMRMTLEEWRWMLRNRIAVAGMVLLMLLTAVATLTAHENQRVVSQERHRYQSQVNDEFDAQPDRHPHRMVHYGHFLFRPLNPWAAFDAGIDAYTGHTLFLEGHRQNSANFGDVRQSSLLLRFGRLTPAFVLQVLAPLLLVFIGYASVVRERESGTLRILLAQGVKARQILAAKLLALSGVAGLMLLPAALAVAWVALGTDVAVLSAALLMVAYALWLFFWVAVVVLASSFCAASRDALLALLVLWAVAIILVPRLLPDVVNAAVPLPSRFETDINVTRDMKALGDGHNPDDPYFAAFRQKILAQYGVQKVEDLPVNYKGLVGMEGERLTSQLFDQYAGKSFDTQSQQGRLVRLVGVVSPAIALRHFSMTVSGTDLESYQRFLAQGERYRYDMVQSLNRLQAEKVSYAEDRNPAIKKRVDRANWQQLPDFMYQAEGLCATLRRALPDVFVLLLWLAATVGLMPLACRRLGRVN